MRKFLLSFALLIAGAMTVGAVEIPSTGVYTIEGGTTGQHRGFLAAGENIASHPVLAEIGWSSYAGNSTEAIEGGKNWYVKSAGDNQFYIYNLALKKFIAAGTGTAIDFSDTPYLWKIVVNSSNGNYNSIRDTNETTYLCFACGKKGANRPVHFNNEAADGGSMHTFTAVGNGETTYAESIEEANSIIEKFGEISYTLTDEGGNVYKGSYQGVRGTTMPTFTGAAGYTLANEAWDGNNLTATINFPVTVSSAEKTNGTTLTIFNDQKFLRAEGTNIKVQTTGVKALDLAAMWAIYPSLENGKFTFTIKNLSTGKYIYSTATAASHNSEGTVILSETASKFVITDDRDFCFDGKTLYLSINSSNDTNVWLGVYGSQHGGTNIYTPTTYGTEANPYLINNVNDFVLFRNSVNAGETSFSAPGVHVALGADIDLADENWVGIGSMTADHGFMGNFDGKTFKIKNLTIDNPALIGGAAYAGLFGLTEGVDENKQNYVKNLTIENVTINTKGQIAAAAIAYAYYTIVENVTVRGNISIKGGDYTAGALAYTRRCVNASNITVAGNDGSTITGATTVGGVISDLQTNGGLVADYSNFNVSGVTITGTKAVGGITGIIAGQTLNGCSVENVTLVADGQVGIVAGSLGAASTITGEVYSNVTGADAIIGAGYDTGTAVEAQVGDTYYSTLADAVKAENDVTLLTAVTLKDDVTYASTSSKTVTGEITYTRNLIAGWNPIYLPFATELSTEEYDVATFTSAEGETVTLTKIEGATATLAANTAYVIRPKNEAAKTLTIALTDATLEAATVNTQELGEGFSVKGNYNKLTGAKLGANDRVVGTNGNWGVLKSTSTLKPYRLILTIPATAKAISMRVEGEDVTSIENLGITIEGDVIFDLMGRRVETMTEGGIYIVNGKKIVF